MSPAPARRAARKAPTATFKITPPPRKRGADRVFEALARDILSDKIAPGTALAKQGELAERFSVSTLVVRQAIHRLEDYKLLRVRQGGPTIVLDPNLATDIRLLELRVQLAPSGHRLGLDTLELRMFFLLQMLVLAERRVTPKQIGVLHYLIDSLPSEPTAAEELHFRLEYWGQVAHATRNSLIEQQMRWWRARAGEAIDRGHTFGIFPQHGIARPFYRALADALEHKRGAAKMYLESIQPVLDWLDAQRVDPTREQVQPIPTIPTSR